MSRRSIGMTMCLLITWMLSVALAPRADAQVLRDIQSVGKVVVTVADDTVDAADVRDVTQRHLDAAGVSIDEKSSLSLVLKVTADRYSPSEACSYAAFSVTLELREPVSLRRDPKRVVALATWSARERGYSSRTTIQKERIMSMVDNVMSRFSEGIQAQRQ